MAKAKAYDVVVVGGGVIGCAIAHRLAREKLRVAVLEQRQTGSGASQASAGMLAPLSDSLGHAALVSLGLESFRLYPAFLKQAEEDGSFSAELMASGILRVALEEGDEARLRTQIPWAKKRGLRVEWLGPMQAQSVEPLLSPAIRGASYSLDEPQLNPVRLVETLRRAAVARGATVREYAAVVGVDRRGSRVTAVRTASETIACGTVVIASGAWAGRASEWLGVEVPVRPVRGQVAYVSKISPPLRHTVMHGEAYAVPKGDGTTLVGTTLEPDAGFAQETTVQGVAGLLTGIQRLAPSIGGASIAQTRAGLRPGTKDGLPILGPAPGVGNAIMAAGHYRSGILLAAVTAKMIGDCIVKGAGAVDFGECAASRLKRRMR